ncbi:DNA breaking-rejoining enzyme [Dendrothele bispora CBS 962.96]|uniref:DNA breaking-rejoining enzyme n=1 Tax=Dendrothele bispora (strain CBS 962.96) TaxID=1314807 RepID=A0A4S8MBT9_DENBC|nr:DNA breaking-rejoining enzyme [Dendrothele bispora CBS 962.96]
MTFTFNRLGHGLVAWHESEVTGEMKGNPSVSQALTSYMVSLRRRKVQEGETPTSSRAVTAEIIGQMFDFNHQPENWELGSYKPTSRKDARKQWGGPNFRRLLQVAYTAAFLCLLRFDEVLKIQVHEIEPVPGNDHILKITLPFRKTDQFGEIKPFYVHALPEEMKHLCFVRAYSDWIKNTRICDGYIFRGIDKNDRVKIDVNKAMTQDMFLRGFRHNLLDIGVDPTTYGTHSFRRGGCQWLSVDMRWPLRKICEWGGWSTDFNHLTIVKYLISWNDDPRTRREDFFNLDRKPLLQCRMCGRTCECS